MLRDSRPRTPLVGHLLAVCALGWAALAGHAAAEVTYREFHLDAGPWAIQMVEFERDSASLRLGVELASGQIHGREPLDEIVQHATSQRRRAVAAITGDFFEWTGDPVGLCIVGGELVSTPNSRVALAILDDGTPVIDTFAFIGAVRASDGATHPIAGVNQACPEDGVALLTRRYASQSHASGPAVQLVAGPLAVPLPVSGEHTLTVKAALRGDASVVIGDGDVVLIGRGAGAEFLASMDVGHTISCEARVDTSRLAPASGSLLHAVGGAGHLLRDGVIPVDALARLSEGFGEARHPRTAFAFSEDRVFLVTVDGRQPGYSVGMSLVELAEFLRELGATEAINLDGGGSTTMWAEGEIKNRPSDGAPRPLANAVVVYQIVHGPHTGSARP